MRTLFFFTVVIRAAALLLSSSSIAGAQPAKPGREPPATTQAQTGADESRRDEARARFEKGVALFRTADWDAALAEFAASTKLFPTRNATENAAVCLRRLKRYDEALATFETLLREFPALPPDQRLRAQREISTLQTLVGTIQVEGSEIDAAISIDGLARGTYPTLEPLRAGAGSHVVRVYKEGFEAFEQHIDLAGGQTVRVKAALRPLTQSGRLRVTERGGRALELSINGVAVGVTPWEGLLPVGKHVVVLRGDDGVGTQPAPVSVEHGKVAALTLVAERLETALIIETEPPGAVIAIDSVEVARGIWNGNLKAGPHRIEVALEGFVPVRRDMELLSGRREVARITLDRDPDAPLWRKPSKWVVEATVALGVLPTLQGDVAASCAGACSQGVGLGGLASGYAGYELGTGIGFGISAGYLFADQQVDNRDVTVTPRGLPSRGGFADERLRLTGVLLAGAAGLRFGERLPISVRMGAGVLLGQVGDARTARFPLDGESSYLAPEIVDTRAATFVVLAPQGRVGLPLTDRLELSAELRVMLLIALSTPRWGEALPRPVLLPDDGYSAYPAESLVGRFTVVIAPGLSARYAF